MWLKERVVNMLRSFLNIEDAMPREFNIQELLDEDANMVKNIVWYRGQPYELSQFYSQVPEMDDTFWGAVQTSGMEIRKIHTGLPALIVDTLTNIIMTDYNGMTFANENLAIKDLWNDIEKDNTLSEVIEEAIRQSLYKGTGAFKLSFDEDITKLPIIEYFGKDKIEIVKKRGRIRELIFNSYVKQDKKYYLLKETYGYGYIKYNLYDAKGNVEYDLKTCDDTKDLENLVFDKSFMMAVPVKLGKGAIYDKKTHNFDALDEAWSQWANALRDARTKTYVPIELIPKDPKTGALLMKPNKFDNKYIKTKGGFNESDTNKVDVEQPSFVTDGYMNTYITALDLCLQGIISPATLGIDTKKVTDPNASAQREKEKTTLWTRGKIVDSLDDILPNLVKIVFYAMQTQAHDSLEEVVASANFGEYANPSFEAQVETVVKAKQGNIMSIEKSVEELYGDSLTDEEKKEEVERLKNEQGIVTDVQIPAVNNVLGGVIDENKE